MLSFIMHHDCCYHCCCAYCCELFLLGSNDGGGLVPMLLGEQVPIDAIAYAIVSLRHAQHSRHFFILGSANQSRYLFLLGSDNCGSLMPVLLGKQATHKGVKAAGQYAAHQAPISCVH